MEVIGHDPDLLNPTWVARVGDSLQPPSLRGDQPGSVAPFGGFR